MEMKGCYPNGTKPSFPTWMQGGGFSFGSIGGEEAEVVFLDANPNKTSWTPYSVTFTVCFCLYLI